MPEAVSTTAEHHAESPAFVPALSVRRRWLTLFRQMSSFAAVGGIAFVVDVGVYNLARSTVLPEAPIWAKVVSVAVATVVAWLGNRYLTFRGERSPHAVREGLLFAAMNIIGLLIAAGCLFVSHYLLGFTSQLADNLSGNVIGLVLGTAFRFAAYRFVVFGGERPTPEPRLTRVLERLPLPVKRTTTI